LKKNKKNHLLRLSIFISLSIHVIAIASLNHIKIRSYLSSSNITFSNKTEVMPYKKKNTKEILNIILKQKQKNIQTLLETKKTVSFPENEKNKNIINDLEYKNEKTNKNEFVFQIPIFNSFKLIENEKILPEIQIEKQNLKIPAFEIKNFATLYSKKENNFNKLPTSEKEKKCLFDLTKEFNTKIASVFNFHDFKENEEFLINDIIKLKQKKIKLFPHNFSLIDMPQLNDLTTLSYKDFFDIEVTFSPQISEKGYIFAITFIPKSSIKLNRLKQNIFFLVDRSNSIQKDRLTLTRHAIISSLSFLNAEDTFNVLAFDTKLDVLSNINLKNDNISLSRTKSFLRKQNIGSFFSSTNFSIPLFKILDKNVKDDEINIAILISNGDGLHKFKNYRVINDWTQLNKGNLSLYTICLNNDKNLSLLDLFSSINKGKLLSSTTNRGIKRKLQKLLKSIKTPIAKDLIANAICLDDKANIKLYPPSNKSPHLYIGEPYTILGTTEKLQEFTIFLQGKCKNNHFNLKKHINFDEAKQGGTRLQKELAMKQASVCYEKYLVDNNPTHLQEAKNHLEPFDIQPIFR